MIARILKRSAAAAMLCTALMGTAYAATPKDTLVLAWHIDDIITLDPGELFELSTSEINNNTYERLIGLDLDDTSKVKPLIAESWSVSEDGKTLTFKIRQDRKFVSGNPLTAEDVVFSLQRLVILDKNPAFILSQFGFTKDNVKDKIRKTGDYEFQMELDKPYATSFVLYCLTYSGTSVVDKKTVMEHEKDGDLGNDWLKTHYAGSGPYLVKAWQANQAVVLERNPNYTGTAPALARVIYRHVPETSAQRLMLEKGDVDIARNLSGDELDAVAKNPDIALQDARKGTLWYISLNQKNATLAKPQVRKAFRYLIDYAAIGDTIMKHQGTVHQAFLPDGMMAADNSTPFSYDLEKAKALLAEAGLPDGFKVTMDVVNKQPTSGMAEAIQAGAAKAGVQIEILPGDDKQTLTKYRARQHDIYIGRWGTDYQDPHSNAQGFASNPDNSDAGTTKTLAWRNAWPTPELNKIVDAAVLERDQAKRIAMYQDLQKQVLEDSPFVIMFQQLETSALRKNVKGFVLGPSFDTNLVTGVTKE